MAKIVQVNRAPVLTLWAAVVAEHMGFGWPEALTLGKAVAGLNAQAKGRRLGIYEPRPKGEEERREKHRMEEEFQVELLGRAVPAKQMPDGVRALAKDRPVSADSVQKYLQQKFGEDLAEVREAMEELAGKYRPQELEREAYALYERFRPTIPKGKAGWGAKGELDLARVRGLAQR